MIRFFVFPFVFFICSCTIQLHIPPQDPDNGGGGIAIDSIPQDYSSWPRFRWKQLPLADTLGAVAVADSSGNGYWSDSLRWENGQLRLGTDTASTKAYARSVNIRSLNGMTGQTQTFATGTSGTDFNISSAANTHTFNLPNASLGVRGVVSTAFQAFQGDKYFNDDVLVLGDFQPAGRFLDAGSTAGPTGYFLEADGTSQARWRNTAYMRITNPFGGVDSLQASLDSLYEHAVGGGVSLDGNGIISAMADGDTQVDPVTDDTYLFFNWPSGYYKIFSGTTYTYESGAIFDYHLVFNHSLASLDFTVANTVFDMQAGRFSLEADTFKLSRVSNPSTGVPMFILDDNQTDGVHSGTGLQIRADANSTEPIVSSYYPIAYLYQNSYRFRLIHTDNDDMQMHFNNVNLDIATNFSKDITVTSADDVTITSADSIKVSFGSGGVILDGTINTDNSNTQALTLDPSTKRLELVDLSSGGIDTIANYTALRAYTGTNDAVHVTNQGFFVRAASGSEDGGTVIVAGNSVVWKRVFDGVTYYPEYWENGGYDETGSAAGITDTTEMIQAAINIANAAGGGEVILRPQYSPYNVIPKVTNPRLSAPHEACVEILSNVKLTILPNTILQKADDVQTDAGGPVDVILGICVENVEISGGGKVLGNTAGQTNWTGGYSQIGVNGAGIYISSSAVNYICNYNIVIRDLEISDHFANPVDIFYFQNAVFENIISHDCGEGPEYVKGSALFVDNIEVADTSNVSVGDGLEISAVDGFAVSNIYIHSNGDGAALELYTSDNGTVTNFVLDGYGGGGVSLGSNASTNDVTDKIVLSNGVIRNYPTGGMSGIATGDGKLDIDNILFDSISVGVNINISSVTAGRANDITIKNCSFYDYASGTGVLIQGKKKVNIIGNSFRKIATGVQISYNSIGNPEVKIRDCVFDSTYTHNIQLDAQTQSPPNYDPILYVENNNFTHALGTKGVNGLGYDLDYVYCRNNTTDSYPTHTTTTSINGMDKIVYGSGGTLTTISNGANGQLLIIDMKDLPSSNAVTVNDPRTSGGGNIYLASGEPLVMATGDVLTLIYDKPNNKWNEVSRAQSGNFFGSGKPAGTQRLVLDGWMVTDVQDSLSHQAVYRFGASSETLGGIAILKRDFAVTRFCIYSNTSITTGSITAELYWNGAGPNKTVVLNSSNPTSNTLEQGRFSSVISAGNVIEVKISTSNDFAHTTADIYIWIEGEY